MHATRSAAAPRRNTPMHRSACPLVVCLALSLGACGGGGADTGKRGMSDDPGDAAAQAAERLDSVRSGQIDATLRLELAFGLKQRLVITEQGSFADARGTQLPKYAAEFTLVQDGALDDLGQPGTPKRSAVRFDGEALYVRAQDSATFVKRPGGAVELNRSTYAREQGELGSGRIPLLALTPGDWMSDARFAGDSTVDGVAVRRIVGTLDVERFIADLVAAKRNEFGLGATLTGDAKKLEDGGDDAKISRQTIELLVGRADGRLRRLRVRLDANVSGFPVNLGKGADDMIGRVQIGLDIDLTELDERQSITAPAVG